MDQSKALWCITVRQLSCKQSSNPLEWIRFWFLLFTPSASLKFYPWSETTAKPLPHSNCILILVLRAENTNIANEPSSHDFFHNMCSVIEYCVSYRDTIANAQMTSSMGWLKWILGVSNWRLNYWLFHFLVIFRF